MTDDLDEIPKHPATPEETAALAYADSGEIVCLSEGYGIALDVLSDDGLDFVGRQYFTFATLDDAELFLGLLRPN